MSEKWHLDRAPGIIGLGTSSPPTTYCALPDPNTLIPSGRQCVFRNAVGFDGNSALGPFALAPNSRVYSCSFWLNYGVSNIPGFTPNPNNQLYMFRPCDAIDTNSPIFVDTQNGAVPGLAIAGYINTGIASYTYPSDREPSAGWVHVMLKIKMLSAIYSDFLLTTSVTEHVQGYINDTTVFDQVLISTIGGDHSAVQYGFNSRDTYPPTGACIGDNSTGIANNNFYGAVAEFWDAPGQDIDWSLFANRRLFHTTNVAGNLYGPVDLGPDGSRPTGVKPRTYLSGPPSLFVNNRADGTALTLIGDALISVDDSPTF